MSNAGTDVSITTAGFSGVFVITTVVLVVGAAAVALLGIGTAGKSLEQITAEELGGAAPRTSGRTLE
jgi:putative MFS transporter